MVQFVSVENIIRFVKDVGIEDVLKGIAERIKDDYIRWQDFDKMPRIPIHSDKGVIELMPTSDGVTYAFKYVNGHPHNFELGKQTVTGFGVLADMETGYPQFLSEMTILTALRTAAISALVGQYLAPQNSKIMAMIGTGCQAEFQAYAFKALCGITNLRIFDIDNDAMDKLEKNLGDKGFTITRCQNANETMIGANIITTCTADKKKATILTDNMIGQGVHINAIGGDCPGKTEIEKAVLLKSDIFVEYEPQTRIEGDIQQLDDDHPVNKIWQLFNGDIEGRKNSSQITIFDSVGFAMNDFSALVYLSDAVQGTNYVEEIDILALPDDPKDLFSLLC
jgi:ornithine cyclodeaminase